MLSLFLFDSILDEFSPQLAALQIAEIFNRFDSGACGGAGLAARLVEFAEQHDFFKIF